jgi:hypothetical protein
VTHKAAIRELALGAVLLMTSALSGCNDGPASPPGDASLLLGRWAAQSVGVQARPDGLQLWLQCGDSGFFEGPIQLDSLNRFAASGTLHLTVGTMPGLIVGYLSDSVLAVQWGTPQRPPSLEQALYYLFPSADGRPTDPDTECLISGRLALPGSERRF